MSFRASFRSSVPYNSLITAHESGVLPRLSSGDCRLPGGDIESDGGLGRPHRDVDAFILILSKAHVDPTSHLVGWFSNCNSTYDK